jgi:hypothetical protein
MSLRMRDGMLPPMTRLGPTRSCARRRMCRPADHYRESSFSPRRFGRRIGEAAHRWTRGRVSAAASA